MKTNANSLGNALQHKVSSSFPRWPLIYIPSSPPPLLPSELKSPRDFFSQLNKEAVKGLYDKYVIDMEMWDYRIEPYLSYAGTSTTGQAWKNPWPRAWNV